MPMRAAGCAAAPRRCCWRCALGAWRARGRRAHADQAPAAGQAPSEPDPPEERRIPGQAPPAAVPPPALGSPTAVPPPQPGATDTFIPVPDRWRILDTLGRKENIFDPYNTNALKGDKPIFGNDWFFDLSAISDTLYQPSRVPVPVGPQSAARPGENSTFGQYGRTLVSETTLINLDLFKGDTAYKPPVIEFRITPAFNFNHTDVGELGVINANPSKGLTRDDDFVGLQEAFVDYHIHNVSDRYDFDSVRVGIQPFSTDFRGFLFQDNQLGVRFFGNRDNNRWQYNLAYFRRLDKDTNSGLNDIGKQLRKDDVFVANVYHQDLPVPGFTSQVTYVRNDNSEGGEFYYDNNGFLIRPAQIGDGRGYNYSVNYLGYNGDGHFGRVNLTTSAYWAVGHQDHNQFSGLPNSGQTIAAFFFAAEPSMDFDWVRVRLSALFASGDNNPQGGRATGFDAIFENPQFAGADSSYWIRQGIPLHRRRRRGADAAERRARRSALVQGRGPVELHQSRPRAPRAGRRFRRVARAQDRHQRQLSALRHHRAARVPAQPGQHPERHRL